MSSGEIPKLSPPVAYQGGKQRLAPRILDELGLVGPRKDGTVFYDLCCGSGAVFLELLGRGWRTEDVVAVDAGPWGAFWREVGAGTFDLGRFGSLVAAVPAEVGAVQAHLAGLAARLVAAEDVPYVFPLLQAGAFGSKAVWVEGMRWRHPGFRSYWLPTATSSRRSPVNPMMPMPATLLTRVGELVERCRGLRAHCVDVSATPWDRGRPGLVYIDPPYTGTTSYGSGFDATVFASSCIFPTWVSEGRALSSGAVMLSGGRLKGGISGNRAAANEEWLSHFPCPEL